MSYSFKMIFIIIKMNKNSFKINLNDSDEESEKILRISKLSSSKF